MDKNALDSYMEYLELRNFTEATKKARKEGLLRFLSWLEAIGKDKIPMITTRDIEAYTEAMQKQGLSENSISSWLYGIRGFFKYLEKTQRILINSFDAFEIPKLKNRLPANILTVEEVKLILASPSLTKNTGIRNRAILETLYSTAIRKQECEFIKVQDVDLSAGLLRVHGKGRKDRVVPLGKKACEYLKFYIEKVRPKYATDLDCNYLFLASKNKRLEGQAINLIARLTGRKLGLSKPVTTHSFRRAAVTHMLRNGAHPVYIKNILGHAGMQTMNKYLLITSTDIKETHNKKHPMEKTR